MKRTLCIALFLSAGASVLGLWSCEGDEDSEPGGDAGTDSDADMDGDADTDTDADGDMDTDGDIDTDSSDGTICAYGSDAPHVCECADNRDNDGDANIDLNDIHCFAPYDDDESDWPTGIPGDNNGANGQWECPFDGNSGIGNDIEDCCSADPSQNLTPNGCDYHACCELDINGNTHGEHVQLGGQCDYNPECGADGTLNCPCTTAAECDGDQFCVMDNDVGPGFCSTCEPCEPFAQCYNPCECGEICFGGFFQPDSECGDDDGCPDGVTECPNGDQDCNTSLNEVCVAGCCYPQCPDGVTPCETSQDCPAGYMCITGCCVDDVIIE